MNLMFQPLLFWAAIPAVALSFWLLRAADAPRSVQILQIGALAVAAAIYAAITYVRRRRSVTAPQWLALPLALSLFMPLVAASPGEPARWLVLGGARLYIAPIVLPLIVLLLAAPPRASIVGAVSVAAAVVALVLQPDAPQLTAFALALLVVPATHDGPLAVRLVLCAALLIAAVVGWRAPDPLAPVRYVEGVFDIAAETSLLVFVAAVAAAVLPVAALTWVAHVRRSRGPFAVAVYLGSLFALAPFQVTPVPLLGFGSGPVLGYFLVAGILMHR